MDYLQKLAIDAGKAIMEIYNENNLIPTVKSDGSPLTRADQAANNIICRGLKSKYPEIPIISEENKNVEWDIRKQWKRFWLVDPLDGTKEFIANDPDFTVNIALIEQRGAEWEPVLGIVYVPVTEELYYAEINNGAYKKVGNKIQRLQVSKYLPEEAGVRIVVSRSHINVKTEEYINGWAYPQIFRRGSSLKFLMIAEGNADQYPRLGPTMEWDTAAAEIILRQAGGTVLDYVSDKKLLYNKPDLHNPYFIAKGQEYFN